MNIKAAVNVLRNMEGDIAEVIAKKGNDSLSYIVYLVSEPSNDDLVKPNLHEWIFGSVDEFEEKFDDETDYYFDVWEFETDFNKDKDKDKEIYPEENEQKTIHWYKVKCSLFKQEFGVRKWDDLIEFMKHNICFDYTITGQFTENYTGVEGYYENGTMHKL